MIRLNLFDGRLSSPHFLVVILSLCLIEFFGRWGEKKIYAREHQPDRNYSVRELHEDFDVLKTTLIEAHGNLYAHITPKNFEKSVQSVKANLDRPMTELEFFRYICIILLTVVISGSYP